MLLDKKGNPINTRHECKLSTTTIWNNILYLTEKGVASIIWKLMLTIGGAFLLLHFFYIEFLPTFDITSLVGVLILAAVTGLIIIGVFALGFVYPLSLWFFAMDSKVGRKVISELNASKLQPSNIKKIGKKKPNYWELLLMFLIPVFMTWLIFTLAHHYRPEIVDNSLYGIVTFTLISVITGYVTYRVVRRFGNFPILEPLQVLFYFGLTFFTALLFFLPFLMIWRIFTSPYVNSPLNTISVEVVTFFILFLVLLINGVQIQDFAGSFNKTYKRRLLFQLGISIFIWFLVTFVMV